MLRLHRLTTLLVATGLVGASMAVVDAWLDRRLPRPRSSVGQASGVYIAVALLGSFFAVGVVATFLDVPLRPVGIALLVSGIATLAWWYLRYRGAERPPLPVRLLGSGGVIAAAVLGFVLEVPEIRQALGSF
jgi:Flp pilus assembly protein TadB